MTVKEESEKAGWELNIKKTKIMASSSITSRQTEGKNTEAVTDFLFLGSKIAADGECSHEIRRQLLFGRKAMTNLDSVLKSKDITLPTKVCIVKPRQCIKKQRHHLADKGLYSQSYGLSSSHVQM